MPGRKKAPTKGVTKAPRKPKVEAAKVDDKAKLADVKLDAVLSSIEGKYGKGSVHLAGVTTGMDVKFVPSGHFDIDRVLGGGWPMGRIIEIYGEASSGKTTLALDCILTFQRAGYRAAFIDVEHALDPEYATAMEISMDDLLISQPDSAEQALDIMDMLVKSGAVNLIVVDSVDALVPQSVINGEVGDVTVAALPRLLGPTVRKVNAIIGKRDCLIIFINQLRSNIKASKYASGPDNVTSGGKSIPYYASVRLETKKIELIEKTYKGDKHPIGQITQITNRKNKVGAPYKKCRVEMRYRFLDQKVGLDRIAPFVNGGLDTGKLIQNGSWFTDADGNKLAQGRDKLIALLTEDPALLERLK